MSVQTNGKKRGWIARWLVRFEASQQIFRIVFLAITAVSTLTTALELMGYGSLAPFVLAAGVIGAPLFAYAYVETGVWNRKNREKMDAGTNFAGPTMRIDDEMIARSILAGEKGRELTDRERHAIKTEADTTFSEYRNGVTLGDD